MIFKVSYSANRNVPVRKLSISTDDGYNKIKKSRKYLGEK